MSRSITVLTRYGGKGASSRVRFLQFREPLARAGFGFDWQPLLPDRYLEQLYAGARPTGIAGYYLARMRKLVGLPRGSTIWLEKEALPWAPALLERGLLRGQRYVLDIDDAIFHNYDLHPNRLVRAVFGAKIDALMRHADCVAAGSPYLEQRARRAGARRVVAVPTTVDGAVFRPLPRAPNEVFTVGWIGSPSTTPYLEPLLAALRPRLEEGSMRMVVIGAGAGAVPRTGVEHRRWALEQEAAWINGFDVGVMPLPDTPWTRGKCAFKLVQYMACGVPVIASPVGMNVDVVRDGIDGFLCDQPAEWQAALDRLRAEPALRAAMGRQGRSRYEQRFALDSVAASLVQVFDEVAGP